jgi:hypothetical protein
MPIDSSTLYHSEMKKFLSRYPWTHAVSLSFKYPPSLEHAEGLLKEWRRKIIKSEKIQLAHMGVFNCLTRRHIHLLMFGRNQYRKTLLDVRPNKIKRLWVSGEADVKSIYDSAGSIGYLIDRNTPGGRHEQISPFNIKLLAKSAIEPKHEGK